MYNDAFIVNTVGSDGRMTDKWWFGKVFEEGSCGQIKALSRHLPGEKKTMKDASQNTWCPSWDLKWAPFK
jgi:hypothetical protein